MPEHRHRLLLVEDHPETRQTLRRMLRLCGWDVAEAATVAEGMDRLDPPPDCVLLDLALPDGDGEAILRKVRDDLLPTRVVVHTGANDPDRLMSALELGPDSLLLKPIDSADLRRICQLAAEN